MVIIIYCGSARSILRDSETKQDESGVDVENIGLNTREASLMMKNNLNKYTATGLGFLSLLIGFITLSQRITLCNARHDEHNKKTIYEKLESYYGYYAAATSTFGGPGDDDVYFATTTDEWVRPSSTFEEPCYDDRFQATPTISSKTPKPPERITDLANWDRWDDVRKAIENGADINEKEKDIEGGKTLLHIAIISNPDIVGYLLSRGANVNAKEKFYGDTPLHAAVKIQNAKEIGLLLDAGANVRENNYALKAPLDYALDIAADSEAKDRRKIVDLIFSRGADVNGKDGNGLTPLQYVSLNSLSDNATKDLMKYLISKGAKPDLFSASAIGDRQEVEKLLREKHDAREKIAGGWTALHVASTEEIAKLLIDHGADVNAATTDTWPFGDKGITPLHMQIINGWKNIVALLIERGADLNARTGRGYTPLVIAVSRDNQSKSESNKIMVRSEIAELLLSKGADVNIKDDDGRTLLHRIVHSSDISLAKELVLKYGADVNAKDNSGDTPLYKAAYNLDNIELAQFLIDNGADVKTRNIEGKTLLNIIAPYSDDWNISLAKELVLKYGEDVNGKDNGGDTPLQKAAGNNNNIELVQFLIDNGADVKTRNNDGETLLNTFALDRSAAAGDISMAKTLVMNYGADVNTKDNGGDTPLHKAVRNDKTELAQFLIESGADVNAKTKSGDTPLHLAANPAIAHPFIYDSGDPALARLLMDAGANVNAKDITGITPLHLAASAGAAQITAALIQSGADVNAADDSGATPLHQAAYRGCGDVVRLLLTHCADPRARDLKGRTPYDTALSQGHAEIAETLRTFSPGNCPAH